MIDSRKLLPTQIQLIRSAMSAIVFEHVPVEQLPSQWRLRLAAANGELVTVRIESEGSALLATESNNPMFGLWRDRTDVVDVERFVRDLREARYPANGTPPAATE